MIHFKIQFPVYENHEKSFWETFRYSADLRQRFPSLRKKTNKKYFYRHILKVYYVSLFFVMYCFFWLYIAIFCYVLLFFVTYCYFLLCIAIFTARRFLDFSV